jgi:hypothetical protein
MHVIQRHFVKLGIFAFEDSSHLEFGDVMLGEWFLLF